MPFPNFIIGGPPKSGTTSLFSWLCKHPDVCGSRVKETYFLYSTDEPEKGVRHFSDEEFKGYTEFFKHHRGEKIIFEATPSYIYSETARLALKQINPELKVLFIYRDSADRLYSEFKFHKYKTKKFNGTFSDYVNDQDLNEGDYHVYINKWIAAFGKDQILLLKFEDLSNHPNKFMKELCGFLEIDHTWYNEFKFETKNPTVGLRNRKFHNGLLRVMNFVPTRFMKIMSPLYYKLNSKETPIITPEELRIIEELKERYASSNVQLSGIFNSLTCRENDKKINK